MKKVWLVTMLVILVGAVSAWARDDWHKVGELTNSGRLPVNQQISSCRLECVDGFAIINTLVVIDGAKTRTIPVTTKLNKGESREIPLGNKANATEVGMSLQTNGRLAVYVK